MLIEWAICNGQSDHSCWLMSVTWMRCFSKQPICLLVMSKPWLCPAEAQELVASRNEVPFLEAVKAALQQAVQSYAPYSRCPSGLAIATAAGAVYSGPYLESAAFNPSLGPLQAAVIDAVTDGIAYYTEVRGPAGYCFQLQAYVFVYLSLPGPHPMQASLAWFHIMCTHKECPQTFCSSLRGRALTVPCSLNVQCMQVA